MTPGDHGAVPQPVRPDGVLVPHPARLDPHRTDRATILAAHRAAVEAGEPTYRDPATGYTVMTGAILAARETCCDNGCRHCPYLGA